MLMMMMTTMIMVMLMMMRIVMMSLILVIGNRSNKAGTLGCTTDSLIRSDTRPQLHTDAESTVFIQFDK